MEARKAWRTFQLACLAFPPASIPSPPPLIPTMKLIETRQWRLAGHPEQYPTSVFKIMPCLYWRRCVPASMHTGGRDDTAASVSQAMNRTDHPLPGTPACALALASEDRAPVEEGALQKPYQSL